MVLIEQITTQNVEGFKKVRLRALQEAPYAFGSTYVKEAQFSESEWIRRAERWHGERGIGFLAMDDGLGCGIAGSFLDANDATRAQLISMWTAPTHRRQGIGEQLVNRVLGWAKSREARVLELMVTSHNEGAIRFYERLGFARTGRVEPYPNDPAVVEYEMARLIG
jgi:ribosomal protein S18 acetylase RimI-like enzyme